MRLTPIVLGTALAILLLGSEGAAAAMPGQPGTWQDPGLLQPVKHKRKHRGGHEYEREYRIGDCEYEEKWKRGKYKYEVECDDDRRHGHRRGRPGHWAHGGPPPWAPAHGYRRKHRHDHYETQQAYVAPFDLHAGRCNRQALGAALGGVAGGVLGSTIGKGDGRTAAIVGGTILGILVGGSIGRSMDEVDHNCIGQALEHAPDGRSINWNGGRRGESYEVTPVKTVEASDGRYCREYTATAVIGGRAQQTYGRACRQPDGSWQIVR